MNKHLTMSCFILLTIIGCQSPKPLSTTDTNTSESKSTINENESDVAIKQVFQQFFQTHLKHSPIEATFIGVHDYNDQFGPVISEENIKKKLEFEKYFLSLITAIEYSSLNAKNKLSYQVFKRSREMAIEAHDIPMHLLPLNQMGGVHTFFAVLGSGKSAQPFNTVNDYDNFIKRALGFSKYMDSVIQAYKVGMAKGIVHPKVIVEKIVSQLRSQVVDHPTESVFYEPINNLPTSFSPQDKQRITNDYLAMIENVIVPSYKKVHDFLNVKYLPFARQSVGLTQLPGGRAWYNFQIKTHTTLNLNAEELHQFGLIEVARILSEMKAVKEQVKFKGDLAAFFTFLKTDPQFYFQTEDELINGYQTMKERIDATLPKMFNVFPKADYEVRLVEKFRAASSAGASYQAPSPDGKRPGIFYINSHNLKAQPKFIMETLSIHEASPGHHFQVALQQEVESLPDFRRFGGYTVYSEGWALYAESLGKELGLFTDPYMWYGRLVDEQLRAMRLVIDTGIHAFGWSREKSIAFMKNNSSMADSDIEAEVERYISTPGQALAYKTGQRKIRELRELAERQLGEHFDIKAFHTQILIDGALPMPILENKIMSWIQSESKK